MTDSWLTPPTIVDGKPVSAHWMKAVYNNMQLLANPTRLFDRGQLTPITVVASTTSATYVEISTKLTKDFESTGRDFYLSIPLTVGVSAVSNVASLDIQVNGVSVSGGGGLLQYSFHVLRDMQLTFPFINYAAGLYTIKPVYKLVSGTGSAQVQFVTPGQFIYIGEF